MKRVHSAFRSLVCGWVVSGLVLATVAGAQEINLDKMVPCGDLICYQALKDPNVFYYLPDRPRLATKDGRPQFSFLKYARTDKTGKAGTNRAEGGGIVHFLVTYGAEKSRVKEAEKALKETYPEASIAGPVVYRKGSFALITSFSEGAETTTRTVAVGKAPLMEGQKAAVSMALTREGAELLWESFKTDTPDISLVFDMEFVGVREPFEATLEADWARISKHQRVQAGFKYAWFGADVDLLFQELRQTGAVRITTKGKDAALEKILNSAHAKLLEVMFDPAPNDELARAAAEKDHYANLNQAVKLLRDAAESRRSGSRPSRGRTGFLKPDPANLRIDFWAAILHFLAADAHATGLPVAVGVAGEESQGPGQNPQLESARERFRDGVSLFRRGRYRDAITVFEESDELYRLAGRSRGEVAYNIGTCHMYQGDYRQAERWFEEALRRFPEGNEHIEDARLGLEEARRRMNAREERIGAQAVTGEAPTESASEAYNRARRHYEEARTAGFPAEATRRALAAYEDYQADHNPTGSRADEVSGRIRMLRERLGGGAAATSGPLPNPFAERASAGASSAAPATPPSAVTPTRSAGSRPAVASGSSAGRSRPSASGGTAPSSRRSGTSGRGMVGNSGTAVRSRSDGSPGLSLVVSYKLKKIKRSGKLVYNMNHYRTEKQAFAMAENIGSLYRLYGHDPKVFRAVTIDDPVFKQREILVTLDGQDAVTFTRHLNFVTVKLRKQHQSGEVTRDEVVITPESFNTRGNFFSLGYGYKGDDDRGLWLGYEYETVWSFHGGVEIRTPWRQTDTPILVLQPPHRYRTVTFEGNGADLSAAGVRHAVITVTSTIAGKPVRNELTIRNHGPVPALVVDIPEDPDGPDVQVSITWHLLGGGKVTAAARPLEGNIVYWDELPKEGA